MPATSARVGSGGPTRWGQMALGWSEGVGDPPRPGPRAKDGLRVPEVAEEAGAGVRVEGLEAVVGRSQGVLAVLDPPPTIVGERHTDALTFERPYVHEDAAFQLPDEMGGRLTGDEQAAADLTRVHLVHVVEQAHDLELRIGHSELDQRFREAGPQDAMDTTLSADEISAGRWRCHRGFILRGTDIDGRQPAVGKEAGDASLATTRQGSVGSGPRGSLTEP